MDVTKEFTDLQFLHILQKAFQSDLITDAMCKRVTAIRVIDKDIRDLSGVEYFVNLEYLNIAYNNIERLDLSHNLSLKELYCYKNDIEALILPDSHMRIISIYGNSKLLNFPKYQADKVITEEKQLIQLKAYKRNKTNNKKDVKVL